MEKPILATMLSCSGLALTDEEKALFSQTNPLGISLFSRNFNTPAQLAKLIKEIKETIGREDVLIGIDQEGGRVRRLREPHYQSYASQYRLGELAHSKGIKIAKEATKLHAQLISADLTNLGINWNYAPVIDVCHSETSSVLQSRTFGSDTRIISQLGQTMVQTYLDNGICPCIKHLPGMGTSSTDPHLALPIITTPLKQLANDFTPFIELKDTPSAMTAHILLPEIDSKNPLTQSKRGIQEIIRKELGYDGFLLSDAIDMLALQGSLSNKVQTSLSAGCDGICYCGGKIEELQEVTASADFLRDKSLIRFEKIRKILHNQQQVPNNVNLSQRYHELIGQVAEYQETYDATETLNRMQHKKGE